MSWTAYVDESIPHEDADPGVYVLAAAVVDSDAVDLAREVMAGQRRAGRRKVHWTRDVDRRTELAKAVADVPAEHLVVVRVDDSGPLERRRRFCLERLFHELQELGVEHVVVEGRQAHQDQADMRMLGALRARRVVTGLLRLDHMPGPAEPLLWIPDVVAGAYGAARQGHGAYFELIAGAVTVYRC